MNLYRGLIAWQRCHRLALAVYRTTAGFPAHERYGLTSQARRAAFSAAANIAEGSARRGHGEFAHFLNISLGSLAEVSYVVDLGADLGYLGQGPAVELRRLHSAASKATWRLYLYHRSASAK